MLHFQSAGQSSGHQVQGNPQMSPKKTVKIFAAAALALSAFLTPASPALAGKGKFVAERPGEIVFLRGLANIFSLGLDSLSDELKKFGVYSYVHNHKAWQEIGNQIIAKNRRGELTYPVVIIGHSLGAGASPKLATMLGRQGIAVQYMVMLDAVEPLPVTNFVEEAVNYYLPKKKGQNVIKPSRDYAGQYENINVRERLKGIDHFNIDENEALRGQITGKIFDLVKAEEEQLAKE